jgi:sigma-E factor negative regulatory protein RseB
VIRDREGVRCVLGKGVEPRSEAVADRSLFPEIPVQELTAARARYLFEVGNSARIAGFEGRRLSILPRDEYRYGYDLWLEKDTGLLLRWVLFDKNRRTLAKLMFTDLSIGDDVDLKELESTTPLDEFVRMGARSPEPTQANGTELPQPAGMPPGFRLAAHGRETGDQARALEHMVLSDGLASVSVYIEAAEPGAAVAQGLSRMGTTNAYSKTHDGRQVTAIGEVPAVTVKMITNAFSTFDD